MVSYIAVHGSDSRVVKVAVENSGIVTRGTLRCAFQLEDNVPIGLFKDGRALGCLLNGSELVFNLGPEFNGSVFELKWEKAKRSDIHRDRPESPYVLDEKLAGELRNRLFFIPKNQKALQDPKNADVSSELMRNDIID
ncbi:hypothetical protein FO519_010363, partial [Halicephalobus sp. NKZ332]